MTLNNILIIAICVLFFLIVVLIMAYFKMSAKEKEPLKNSTTNTNKSKENKAGGSAKSKTFQVQSVFDFMEFNKIEDNMIIQKNGKKYLMVIECQGINYDLMSEIEKVSVEEGFIQFLNTLRHPIQLYIQTRTINLGDSIQRYKKKLEETEDGLQEKENKYKQMVQAGTYSDKDLQFQKLEVDRQRNLYEYGKDIIFNTERMSSNKNVLRKQYYIVISYFYSETDKEWLDNIEIKDIAFSELYTKCQSTIRALSGAGVSGEILDSYGLVDLLYNAYNRDEAETFGIDKAIESKFDELYVTAEDILDKKMKALDTEIEKRALERAQEAVETATREKQKQIDKKEKNFDDIIEEIAEHIITENEKYIGEDIAESAKKNVKKKTNTKVTAKRG